MKYAYTDEGKRHLHTADEKPLMGTTTLINEMMPAPFTWWAAGMALTPFGWMDSKKHPPEQVEKHLVDSYEKVHKLTIEEYNQLLQKSYRAHDENKKEAGEAGTEVHDAIEQAVKEAIASGGFLKTEPYEHKDVERFATWGRGKRFIHSEVHVYSELLWLGGIVDLVYEEDEKTYIGDIKTSKGIYDKHFFQMGLYDCQQLENGFVDDHGNKVGESLSIDGYTVINIPRINNSVNVKTFRGTQELRQFGTMLVEGYKLKQTINNIIK